MYDRDKNDAKKKLALISKLESLMAERESVKGDLTQKGARLFQLTSEIVSLEEQLKPPPGPPKMTAASTRTMKPPAYFWDCFPSKSGNADNCE